MRGFFRSLQHVLVALLVVYLGLMLWLYYSQHELIFLPELPTRELQRTPAELGLSYEDLLLQTPDGQTLHGWYIPYANAQHVVLFLHGNAGNISHRLSTISRLRDLQLSILLFDYRGFGKSSGETTEQGTYLDARTAWDYLRKVRGFADRQIIVHGRSLGGAVAAELATRIEPGAVILESTFTSIPRMGAEVYPWLPVSWLARIEYDNLARVGQIRAPVLILHSPQDELVPFAHGRALYDAVQAPKQFVALQAGHNEGFLSTADYVPALRTFLQRYVPSYAREHAPPGVN